MVPLISVIVCTFNREVVLRECLQSLVDQTLDKNNYEVIIVNNNSTDNTQRIVDHFINTFPNFRILFESKQGLSYARNLGWQQARGEYVAYIDDDARADPDWVYAIHLFVHRRPDVPVFGGPYEAFSLEKIPSWFPEGYGRLNLGEKEHEINVKDELITGTNVVFKKDLLKQIGGFDSRLGMRGNMVSYGEEVRLLLEVARRGLIIYYVPALKVKHLIAGYKMNLRWLLLSRYATGRCSALISNEKRSVRSILIAIVKNLIKIPLKLFYLRRIPFKRRLYDALAELFIQSGSLVEYFNEAEYSNINEKSQ